VAITGPGVEQDHPQSVVAPARRFRHWIPAILVAILISVFSTHYFSSEQTGRVIYPILRWFLPLAPQRTLYLIHVAIRKLAHITEFGTFSIAVFHGVRGSRPGWRLNWAVLTLLIASSYAGLDEWHQSFVKFREARARDVFIDVFGALCAQALVWAYAKWSSRLRVTKKDGALEQR
jgi:VanZ family protein